MSVPKVSVILPVYNAAAYIEQCIRSVFEQTLREIEIIAVNDGSTDNSAQILDRLATTDVRLKVVHQQNKGVSATRNYGLEVSTGSYIAFCDADDWMAPCMLQELYDTCITNDCDWAICNVNVIQEEKLPKLRLSLKNELVDISASKPSFLHELMRFKYDYANWNKLFRSSVIKQQGIKFDELMCVGEDLLFNLQYMQFAKKVAIVAKPFYYYRVLSTSLYSGQTADRLPQFNLLYKRYLSFATIYASGYEVEAFKREMARIAYNQFLHETEVNVKAKYRGFIPVWRGYYSELRRFTPDVFYFPLSELRGLQGIKKRLLQNRLFLMFAFIIAAKVYFKQPYIFIRRIFR